MASMKNITLLVIGIILIAVGPAQAVLIVDTGPGPQVGYGWALDSSQSGLAAEFTTTQYCTINGIQGWMFSEIEGIGTIALYSDGGEVPGTEMFSTGFSAPVTGGVSDWYGASGLAWDLPAGTYWVAFEVRSGETLVAGMPNPAESPLGNEAFRLSSWSGYAEFDPLGIGVRIDAQVAQVPEPATLLLLGAGLVGVGMARRRLKG